MTANTELVVGLCTCAIASEARKLAHAMVESRLAACVNVVPSIESVYSWQGKVESTQECLLIVKTTAAQAGTLADWLAANHDYDVPEWLVLSVAESLPDYRRWLGKAVAT